MNLLTNIINQINHPPFWLFWTSYPFSSTSLPFLRIISPDPFYQGQAPQIHPIELPRCVNYSWVSCWLCHPVEYMSRFEASVLGAHLES